MRFTAIILALATAVTAGTCSDPIKVAEPNEDPPVTQPEEPRPHLTGQIAYWGPGNWGSMINVMDLSSGEVRRLEATRQRTEGNSGPGRRLSWSPDGSKIAFEGRTACATPEPHCWYYETYEINLDGSRITKLTTGLPIWSSDGARVTFAQNGVIHLMNSDGSGRTQLTKLPDSGWTGEDTWPTWSPDRSTIVFARNRRRCVADCSDEGEIEEAIYSVKPDGSGLRRVIDRLLCAGDRCAFVGTPAWSPDGSKIALSSYDGIWLVNPDGSGATLLIDGRGVDAPSWSPDGEWLAFHGYVIRKCDGILCNVSTKVFVVKADGSQPPLRVTTDEYASLDPEMYPVWRPSPEGK